MLFTSIKFLFFFPIITILFYLLPHKYRWLLLLIASCIFYIFFIPVYIFVLFLLIVIDYVAGIYIEKTEVQSKKRLFLAMSIIANVGVLTFFKYFNFLNDNLSWFAQFIGKENPIPFLHVLLPLGLSFHTFQAMGYTIEVYRSNYKAEKKFGIFALYVMFYPQLVAGPIERPSNLIPQFYEKKNFNYTNAIEGLKMMLWGFFKKLVIADRLSVIVNYAYHSPDEQNGFILLIGAFCFLFQLYCDFSAYSDIAIGSAKVMGIHLMENVRTPLLSKSIIEFWKRCHISLYTWIRDYVYIPLGGNKVGIVRRYINLIIVFLVFGFWHGANWTFIVFGAFMGLYYTLTIFLKNSLFNKPQLSFLQNKLGTNVFLVSLNFLILLFTHVLFRANNIHDAMNVYTNIFTMFKINDFNDIINTCYHLEEMKIRIGFTLVLLFIFAIVDPFMDDIIKNRRVIQSQWFNYLIYSVIFSCIILFGYFGEIHFIYGLF